MRWIFNPPVWLLVPLALLVAGLSLWVFFPPSHSRRKNINHSAAEVIAPIPVPPMVQALPPPIPPNAPDASGTADALTTADAVVRVADVAAAREGSTSDDAILVLETVGGVAPQLASQAVVSPSPAPFFLKVRKVFESEKDAAEYAEDVLSEHGVEDCQIGVMVKGASQRFFLLVGPFKTGREAARVQSRLTAARVRTLFIGERFLRRFQSIEPVSPPKASPSVSVRALTSVLPVKPYGQAVSFLGRPVPSAYFCKQWGASNPG